MLSREALYNMYVLEDKTRQEISEELNVPVWKLKKILKQHKIKKPDFRYDSRLTDRETLAALYQKHTIQQISQMCSCSEDVVSKWLRQHDLHTTKTKGGVDSRIDDPVWLSAQLASGMSQKDIMQLLGVSKPTLNKYLTKHKLRRQDRYESGPYTKLHNREWLSEQKKNKTDSEIAQDLGLVQSTVTKAAQEQNITERSPSSQSRMEREFYYEVSSHCLVRNTRSVLESGQELDFWFPEHNVAVELNGLYYHSEIHKPKTYHKDKLQEASRLGVRLIQIWEHEWYDQTKREIVLSMVRNALGDVRDKVRASKCDLVCLTHSQYRDFCEANHIQGSVRSPHRYGLMHKNKLVAVMGFGQSRFEKDTTELHRFAVALNTRVYGAASKLFQYAVSQHNWDRVVSYCDLRYGTGNLYKAIGFVYQRTTNPNYFYYRQVHDTRYTTLSRHQAQKHKLPDLLGSSFDPSLTEAKNMNQNRYFRVYDCGNSVWKWTRPRK